MASKSVVDQIVKSLSFEVEAVPQHQDVESTSSSNMTPMNVKIKVRKKHETDMEKGIISVQKSPGGAPERIRLVSSDQTIMSFDVLMEAEFAKKGQRKPRKNFFGGCLGTQYDDDDGPYVPSSTYNAKKDDTSISSKSEGVLKHNFTLLKHQRGKTEPVPGLTKHYILGKCKPGGCLDPPFGEDKYPYKPVDQNVQLSVINLKDKIKEKTDKKGDSCKKLSKTRLKDKAGDDSLLRLKETDQVEDSLNNDYSASIITYPPEVSSTQNIQDKLLRSRISSAEKQRKSTTEGSEIFYSPAKKNRSDSRDRKLSHEAFPNADTGVVGNRKKLRMTKKKKEDVPTDYENKDNPQSDMKANLVLRSASSKSASLDQNLQEGTTRNEDSNQRKQNDVKRKSVNDIRDDVIPRSSNIISSETEEQLKSKGTKTAKKVIPLVIPIPLAGENNVNVTPNEKLRMQMTAPEQLTADENHKRDFAQLLNNDRSTKQEELSNIDENMSKPIKISPDDYNKATAKEFEKISSGSINGSTGMLKPHKYSLPIRNESKDQGNKGNVMTLNKLSDLKEPTSTGKEATKHSDSSEIFPSGESNNIHSYDDSNEQNEEGKEKPKIRKISLKHTSVDMPYGIHSENESIAGLIADDRQRRPSKPFSSEDRKLDDNKPKIRKTSLKHTSVDMPDGEHPKNESIAGLKADDRQKRPSKTFSSEDRKLDDIKPKIKKTSLKHTSVDMADGIHSENESIAGLIADDRQKRPSKPFSSEDRKIDDDKPKIRKTSLKHTSVDMPDGEHPKNESIAGLIADDRQKRPSKPFSSEDRKLDDNERTPYFERDSNGSMKDDTKDYDNNYRISADAENYSNTKGISPELHSAENLYKPFLRSHNSLSHEVDEKILRRETEVSMKSRSSLTDRFSKIKTPEDQFSERENLQNIVPNEDDLRQRFETDTEEQTEGRDNFDHPQFEHPITKKQNISENANDTDSRRSQEVALRNNLRYLHSESSDYNRGNEQGNFQDSNHLLNKYNADYDDSVSNIFSKPMSGTVDNEYLSDHSLIRPEDTDYETTNIYENQIPPTKLNLKNMGQSLENAAIRKFQDKGKGELTPSQYELGKTYQASAPPSVFGDDYRDYNKYSKQYGEVTSDASSQRSLDNIVSQTQEMNKPLNHIRYNASSLQSSMSSTSKQNEKFGNNTKEYENAPQFRSGSTKHYEDVPQFRESSKNQYEDMPQFRSGSGSTKQYEDVPRLQEGSKKQFDDMPQFREGSTKQFVDVPQSREGSTNQFEDVPKHLYGKPIDPKYTFSDKHKNGEIDNMYAPGTFKSSLKNDSLSLNLGFTSYENDKKERILETFNTSDVPTRKPDDTVTVIKSLIRPQINDLRIPIDSENEMSIQIRRNKSPLKVQIEGTSTTRFDKLGGKIPDKETQDILNDIYERDLLPLQKAFKGLKRDLDVLASQKRKSKDKAVGPIASKTIRVVKVKPKCDCWEKW